MFNMRVVAMLKARQVGLQEKQCETMLGIFQWMPILANVAVPPDDSFDTLVIHVEKVK